VGQFLKKTRPATKTGTVHKGMQRMPNLAQPTAQVTSPTCGR
jgi:hypothetical protein